MTVTRTDWRTKVHQLAPCRGTLRVWVETNSGAELLADGDDACDLLDALEAVDYVGLPEPPDEEDQDETACAMPGCAETRRWRPADPYCYALAAADAEALCRRLLAGRFPTMVGKLGSVGYLHTCVEYGCSEVVAHDREGYCSEHIAQFWPPWAAHRLDEPCPPGCPSRSAERAHGFCVPDDDE